MYLNECDEAKIKKVIFEEGREEGREEGAKGIIRMALKFNGTKDFIIENLVTELNITTQKAEEYYKIYAK